jgi:Domain of unknown function (DUF4365)
VARQGDEGRRKRRTREHVIADLGVNHTERQVLLGKGTAEYIAHDYGIDLVVFTFDDQGEQEPGQIRVQVKATEQIRWLANGQSFAFRISRADVRTWLRERDPVILVVYDATANRAWWVHVQGYFNESASRASRPLPETISLRIPRRQTLRPSTLRQWATISRDVFGPTFRVVSSDEP